MAASFPARVPALSEAELRRYLQQPLDYRTEAVRAAGEELRRRGLLLDGPEWSGIMELLEQRDAAASERSLALAARLLGRTPSLRASRIRRITGTILVLGLGSSAWIYVAAGPLRSSPLGYEPENTKKYLRELELYGGNVNVVATELRRWFEGLWQGQTLAFTVAFLTVVAACGFWFVSTRLIRGPLPAVPEQGGDGGAGPG